MRSSGSTVDDEEFRTFVEGLASESRETGVVSNAQTYVDVDDGRWFPPIVRRR